MIDPNIAYFLQNPTQDEESRYKDRSDWAVDTMESFLHHAQWLTTAKKPIDVHSTSHDSERYPGDVILAGLLLSGYVLEAEIKKILTQWHRDPHAAREYVEELKNWAFELYADIVTSEED